jgi:hypothetical protein
MDTPFRTPKPKRFGRSAATEAGKGIRRITRLAPASVGGVRTSRTTAPRIAVRWLPGGLLFDVFGLLGRCQHALRLGLQPAHRQSTR